MHFEDHIFDGSRSLYYSHMHLQLLAGSAQWFPEFTPTDLVALNFMFALLREFFNNDICCHVGGSFPTYLAGVQTRFRRVPFFIALKYNTLLNLIFQRGVLNTANFQVGEFEFTLLDIMDGSDICRYIVKKGEQEFYISFVGIDCAVDCGTISNVDFVYFMWRCIRHDFLFRRHAITILHDPSSGTLRLLCLRHYDVPSIGWMYGSGCVSCQDTSRENIRVLTSCVGPAEACACNICRRQPPSLRDLAAHAVLTLRINIERFQLTRDVTFGEYRHAVDSNRVGIDQLLPPDFPYIGIQYRYSCCHSHPFHAACAPDYPWLVAATRRFDSARQAVRDLYSLRRLYWFMICNRPLFFAMNCPHHGKGGNAIN